MVAAHLEVGRTLVVQRRVVADRVEEDVELRARVLARELRREVALLVVEDVVGAEGRDELARGRRTGRDDGGTVGLGELREGRKRWSACGTSCRGGPSERRGGRRQAAPSQCRVVEM